MKWSNEKEASAIFIDTVDTGCFKCQFPKAKFSSLESEICLLVISKNKSHSQTPLRGAKNNSLCCLYDQLSSNGPYFCFPYPACNPNPDVHKIYEPINASPTLLPWYPGGSSISCGVPYPCSPYPFFGESINKSIGLIKFLPYGSPHTMTNTGHPFFFLRK